MHPSPTTPVSGAMSLNQPSVDSADIEDVRDGDNQSFLLELWQRMNPSNCLPSTEISCQNPLLVDDAVDFDREIPALLKDIRKEGKPRSNALLRLYRLTDRDRQHNRIPMICSSASNVIEGILPCLSAEASSGDRRQALLFVNNLCIPVENKAAILLGEPRDALLTSLITIVRKRLTECYLAVVCLYNLSYLEDGKTMMLKYVPVTNDRVRIDYRHQAPEDNPDSLLRVLESMSSDFMSHLQAPDAVHSVQGEAVRWSLCVVRNLATVKENADIVATTTAFPGLAVKCLDVSRKDDLALWKRDSVEDAALMLLVHIARRPGFLEHVDEQETRSALSKLVGRGGIHEMRATAILCRLDGKEVYDPSSSLIPSGKTSTSYVDP